MKCLQKGTRFPIQKKVLLIMKLTLAFILFFTFQLYANGYGQQKINLKAKKIEVKEVLSSIEKQTNYRFLYNNDLIELNNTVAIHAKNAGLEEVLPDLFNGTALTYLIMDNDLIVVKENPAIARDVVVRGQVMDDKGAPLSGVSVMVKGTTTGTTTNANGEFSLTVPNANAILVFTSVGYDDLEQPLSGSNTINVVMKASQKVMDQVVVIGYGTAAKRDLTGSIVKIEGKEVADKPNTNPVASLQGKVAGLSVVPYGTPGKTPDIRIRGTNSIGSIRPLYVVDGIFNDNIDFLNPNDIESIEILKDPSSLAIFGVRGANGVIAVTTKKAKAGQVLVNFNTSFGAKKLTDKIKVLTNAEDFITLYKEENDNIGAANTFDFTPWKGNTDWIDAVTQTGLFNNNNLSVTASTEKNKLYVGLGYISDQGIVRHEQLKKYLINLSDEFKINKAIRIGFTFNAARTHTPNDGTGALEVARRIAPVVSAGTFPYKMRIYGADSITYNLYSALPTIQNTLQNPLVSRENTWNAFIGRENRYVGSIYGELNFLRDFNFRAAYYGDLSYLSTTGYNPLYAAYDPAAQKGFLVNQVTSVSSNEDRWQKYQQDYVLTYKKKIEAHNITATAGWTTYYFSHNKLWGNVQQSLSGDPIPFDKRFWYISNGFEDESTAKSGSSQNESATTSFLARILYNFSNKYYFNASFRRDGSSLIYNPDQRYLNMWAIGAAWDITREEFMQNQSAFDYLKLKGSIGLLGNQNTYGVDYPYFPTLMQGNTAVFGSNVYPAYVNNYEVDPNLHWETVLGKELGIEFAAANKKLNGEINYYHKITKGMLAFLQNGPKRTLGNFGEIMNKGLEVSAAWKDNISPDFGYNISANLTTYKNKVLKFGTFLAASESSPNQTEVGFPIGYFYGYEVEGIYQSYADKLSSPTVVGYDYGPGDLKYKDLNGDGVVNTDDRKMIGNPTPDFTYGFSLGTNYKGFDASIDFNGSYGAEVYRVWGSSELPYSRYNYAQFKLDRWHGEGTSNWVPRLGDKYAINRLPSTFGIEDGSYLRLRNIQIGYNFGAATLAKAKIKNLRIYANVQNLKTFKNNSGYTPEFGGDPTYFGVDWGNGPVPVIYTGGINITF
jgi:TonB-linked SusC/RagA family outer membrane protein